MTTVAIEVATTEDRCHNDADNRHGQEDDWPSLVVTSEAGTGSSDDTVGSEEAEVVLQHDSHVELQPGAPCGYFCC